MKKKAVSTTKIKSTIVRTHPSIGPSCAEIDRREQRAFLQQRLSDLQSVGVAGTRMMLSRPKCSPQMQPTTPTTGPAARWCRGAGSSSIRCAFRGLSYASRTSSRTTPTKRRPMAHGCRAPPPDRTMSLSMGGRWLVEPHFLPA